MPPPPLLWVAPTSTGQDPRSLEMLKGMTASESPLKEQDLMVSMNQVLPPTRSGMAASGNGGITLVDIKKANYGKESFVKGKGDGGCKVQGQRPIKSTESNQELMKKTPGNNSCLAVQVEKNNMSPELETSSPTCADSGPLIAQPKKTVSPTPAVSGLLSTAPKKTASSTLPNPGPLGISIPPKKKTLPIPADFGPLAAQPSAPPQAVVSQDLSQVHIICEWCVFNECFWVFSRTPALVFTV